MKVKRKAGPPLGPWDIAACVMAGLLYLDVLCFLILTVAGIGLLLVYALECGIVTGVLLLLGMFLYFLGKSRGMGKLSRRLLLGGLIAGGVLLLLFALFTGALGIGAAARLEVKAGYYECPHCGALFVPTMADYVKGLHTLTRRRLTCPACGKTSMCRHRVTR